MSSIHKLFPALTRGILSVTFVAAIGTLAGCHVHHHATTAPVALTPPISAAAEPLPAPTPATVPVETASVMPAEVPATSVAPTTISVAIPIGAVGGYRQFPPQTCYYQNGNVMAYSTYELKKPMPSKIAKGYTQEMINTGWHPILFAGNVLLLPIEMLRDPFWNLQPYTGFEGGESAARFSPDFPTRSAGAGGQ